MKELLITTALLLFPFVIPMYTVWKHPNWKGVLLSAFVLWIFMAMAEAFLIGQYGSGGPGGAMLLVWIVLGLPISVVLRASFPISVVLRASFLCARRLIKKDSDSPESARGVSV